MNTSARSAAADPEQAALLRQGAQAFNQWRRDHPEARPRLAGANLSGLVLAEVDLAQADLRKADLTGADLNRATLAGADLGEADLRQAKLTGADLRRARLSLADLRQAELLYANLRSSDLRGAHLGGASLEDADLRRANLSHAEMKGARLAHADLCAADLSAADLSGADLRGCNLEGTRVQGVKFNRSRLWSIVWDNRGQPKRIWSHRRDVLLGTPMRCRGINSACQGSQRFKLFLQDQDYLEEFMAEPGGRWWGAIWWLFADCGRSTARWAGWALTIAFVFGLTYWMLGIEHFALSQLPPSLPTMIYYSVVTFTTLGFGDITPRSHLAAYLVMAEVIMGYVMLGGLITIFSTKLARRGG